MSKGSAVNENELFRLYAVALTLVPDPDVAGDLFMTSADEEDLRRRARAWRRKEGLDPEPDEAALPELDEDQRQHALHLARRGRKRRRVRTLFPAVAVLLVMASMIFGASLKVAPLGLAADPAFARDPAESTPFTDGLRLAVYRAESTPGSVTVWWSVVGRNAADAAGDLKPGLFLDGNDGPWLAPAVNETTAVRRDRLLGRSTYHQPTLNRTDAMLYVPKLNDRQVDWKVRVPVTRLSADPQARTVTVNGEVSQGSFRAVVLSVTLGENYTLVRYSATGFRQELSASEWLLEAMGGETALARYGRWEHPGAAPGVVEIALGPVPKGADTLTVGFPRMLSWVFEQVTIPLTEAGKFRNLSLDHGHFSARLAIPETNRLGVSAVLIVEGGQRYPARVETNPTRDRDGQLWSVSATGLPPGARPVGITVELGRPISPNSVTIPLHK